MAVSTTAQNKKDVDSMNVRDRLYDSLSYTYGKRGEDIEKQYNKLTSQTNNSLLSRGMQRSSYGAQTAANIGKQMVDALGQNASDLIADYENRLYQVEQDEREQANWEKQYQESIRQHNEEMAERKRQFDLQYALQSAAASGGGGGGGNGGNDGNGGDGEGGSDPYDAFLNALFGGSNANPGLDRVTGSLAGNSALGSSVTYNRNSPIANATRTDRNKMLTGPNAIYR